MDVLHHMRPYFVEMFLYIALHGHWIWKEYKCLILIYRIFVWRFPEMWVPLVVVHLDWDFLYKPSSYWGTPVMESPINPLLDQLADDPGQPPVNSAGWGVGS